MIQLPLSICHSHVEMAITFSTTFLFFICNPFYFSLALHSHFSVFYFSYYNMKFPMNAFMSQLLSSSFDLPIGNSCSSDLPLFPSYDSLPLLSFLFLNFFILNFFSAIKFQIPDFSYPSLIMTIAIFIMRFVLYLME